MGKGRSLSHSPEIVVSRLGQAPCQMEQPMTTPLLVSENQILTAWSQTQNLPINGAGSTGRCNSRNVTFLPPSHIPREDVSGLGPEAEKFLSAEYVYCTRSDGDGSHE